MSAKNKPFYTMCFDIHHFVTLCAFRRSGGKHTSKYVKVSLIRVKCADIVWDIEEILMAFLLSKMLLCSELGGKSLKI